MNVMNICFIFTTLGGSEFCYLENITESFRFLKEVS